MTSMKYHDVKSDDEINDDHHRVYSPCLGEHVNVVIPVFSEREHRQDHVNDEQIETQQDNPPHSLSLLYLYRSLRE